jgi:predicted nucleic acid-binding Zn ribbon protein
MPLYRYRRANGSTFEVMQSIHDEPMRTDPKNGQPVERVLFAPVIHFKGKGFHNNDYGTRTRPLKQAQSRPPRASGPRGNR